MRMLGRSKNPVDIKSQSYLFAVQLISVPKSAHWHPNPRPSPSMSYAHQGHIRNKQRLLITYLDLKRRSLSLISTGVKDATNNLSYLTQQGFNSIQLWSAPTSLKSIRKRKAFYTPWGTIAKRDWCLYETRNPKISALLLDIHTTHEEQMWELLIMSGFFWSHANLPECHFHHHFHSACSNRYFHYPALHCYHYWSQSHQCFSIPWTFWCLSHSHFHCR